MVTNAGWLGIAPRAALAAAAAAGMIGLAACGGATGGGMHSVVGGGARSGSGGTRAPGQPAAAARASAGVPLCAATGRLDRMVVIRPSGVPHAREVLPGGVTIRDLRGVQELAAALCELPPMPPRLACPPNSGGAFRLGFAAGRRGFRPVIVQISGCRWVTGLGPARSWAHSARFGRLLSRTLQGPGSLVPGRMGSTPDLFANPIRLPCLRIPVPRVLALDMPSRHACGLRPYHPGADGPLSVVPEARQKAERTGFASRL